MMGVLIAILVKFLSINLIGENMKHTKIFIMLALVLILTSCSTPQTTETVPYEYEYEILNTRANCEPDLETWTRLYSAFNNPELIEDKSEIDTAIADGAAIVECTVNILQSNLTQRGVDGWKLVAFEALLPGAYDLGVEYNFRLVWERPMATP